MCYSDIPLLYRLRGLVDGATPYLDSGSYPVLEYPVLTGALLELERLVTVALGAPVGPGLSGDQALVAADLFTGVNVVVLGLLFGVTVAAQVATVPGRPWDAVMVAASPCVMAAGLINWDLLPVALTAAALLAWSRSRPGVAGALIGLGAAAKLYPLLLLGPLVLLCLRARRGRDAAATVLAAAGAWALVNVPVLLLAPDGWLAFWRFNAERGAEFGSLWYVLALAGQPVPALNLVSFGLLGLACAGIALLALRAPRRPRTGQLAFLVVAAFLVTGKVYSPQYVLWLLPLLVLARPRWRDWLVFTTGELVYFVAIWLHLGGWLGPADGGPDVGYWLAVLLRLACEGWVVAVVVRDVWWPHHDPVRVPGVDDPSGGVLDGAPDAPWPWSPARATAPAHAGVPAASNRPAGEGVPIEQVIARIRAGARDGDDAEH
nr:glycosyltransferase 87 family protein [Auraticoccus cholistanensis]